MESEYSLESVLVVFTVMLSQIEIETIQIMDRWRQEKCSVLEDQSINNLAKSQACTIPQC